MLLKHKKTEIFTFQYVSINTKLLVVVKILI